MIVSINCCKKCLILRDRGSSLYRVCYFVQLKESAAKSSYLYLSKKIHNQRPSSRNSMSSCTSKTSINDNQMRPEKNTYTKVQQANSIRLPGVYAPSTKKLYFKMSKKFDKNFYMYISTIYVCLSSFARNKYCL
jgi:hypothetical protein